MIGQTTIPPKGQYEAIVERPFSALTIRVTVSSTRVVMLKLYPDGTWEEI